jgi:hypothetical protein
MCGADDTGNTPPRKCVFDKKNTQSIAEPAQRPAPVSAPLDDQLG